MKKHLSEPAVVNLQYLRGRRFLVDLKSVPFHMINDYQRRNANVLYKKDLCQRCDGTGNDFYSAYHKCDDCKGLGIAS